VYTTVFGGSTAVFPIAGKELTDDSNEVNRYAQVSKLARLKDGDPDQIRLWVTWATFDPSTNGIGTTGYAITGTGAVKCLIGYLGKSLEADRGTCRRYSPPTSRTAILSTLERFAAYANMSIDCGTMDGAWTLLDVVSKGKHFIISANNPGTCTGDAASRVSELLRAVQ
jgi:hypothetical protein